MSTVVGVVRADAVNEPAVSQESQDALRKLKSSSDADRQKAYDLLADKGDARLIPPLRAFEDGLLQDRDGRLVIYGHKTQVSGKGDAFPILDAFTLQPLKNPDGSDLYLFRKTVDLSAPGMMRLPPSKRAERATIADLISSLSLLDPDPAARLQSIREAGERAAHVFVLSEDQDPVRSALSRCAGSIKLALASSPRGPAAAELNSALASISNALEDKPTTFLSASPSPAAASKAAAATSKVQSTLKATSGAGATSSAGATPALKADVDDAVTALSIYQGRLDAQSKSLEELSRYVKALRSQLQKDPNSQFASAIREALASLDLVTGERAAQLSAVRSLGDFGTARAANLLAKASEGARRCGDGELASAAELALAEADHRQGVLRFVQNTFAGLSLGSILVLLALGLSIVFGLMGVINMAHGEFMMLGAFTTFVVSSFFRDHFPGLFNWYLVAAVPAAFLVSAGIGYLCELVVIRHLYGRPLETLLATWGVSLILIQAVRNHFGSNLSIKPPAWMEGGVEVVPDLTFPLNRIYIIVYCAICIAAVYFVVNRTKLGLLLRATTQNRPMAASLGVATRRVDGFTFAIGCGLAGLAGVAVPLYNKINPDIGQEYIVDSFMVVVVGGVGALAGAIWAGIGLGFLSKYLEPLLEKVPRVASGASVMGKVVVLLLIIAFLQWKPAGLFPPKGRMADA